MGKIPTSLKGMHLIIETTLLPNFCLDKVDEKNVISTPWCCIDFCAPVIVLYLISSQVVLFRFGFLYSFVVFSSIFSHLDFYCVVEL